jgi:DMSO/TMAO reductase YedYZ heme-binding membrane subunit
LLCALAGAFAIAVVVVSVSSAGAAEDGWRLAARYTARFSFFCFLPVYVASAWRRLAPSRVSRWLLSDRRSLGLAFATAHTVHLAALVTFSAMAGQALQLPQLIGGGGAYGMMFAMAATSNDASVRRLGPRNWKRLHRVGVHWLWFVFAFTYAGRIASGRPQFIPMLALAVLALALRIAARSRAAASAKSRIAASQIME